ncbi:MAG: hypothetical protein RMJ82_11375 [Gemmatales bacterium]|nr:hypothetical protein [Gemmatales bacterium]
MSTVAPEDRLHPLPHTLLPATRVRIQDSVRVGHSATSSHDPQSVENGQELCEVQIRTLPENGEIRYIEVQCSCGRLIRLRCEYQSDSP